MKAIGTFGSYAVVEFIESKRLFVDKTETDAATGEESTTKLPIRKFKRVLQLTHACGDIVCFTVSLFRGEYRYKDSRSPKKSLANPTEVISELRRMLLIDEAEAKHLLGIREEQANGSER